MNLRCRIGLHWWRPVMAATWWPPGSLGGNVKNWTPGRPVQVACKCRRCGKRVIV